MTTALQGTPIAALVTGMIEGVEFGRPPVGQAGGYIELLSSQPGEIRTPDNDPGSAGADGVGGEIVIDGNLISGRPFDDLPTFCQAVVEQFAKTGAGAS
ncbi:hypothetical protein AB0H42_27190 [Nocardia sp. NPDC050799]|uniref:hypothetical protein n=1 Tax=Nocardia sp. NPDC050799 TaxID=3154842 RepID=UPI00341074D8